MLRVVLDIPPHAPTQPGPTVVNLSKHDTTSGSKESTQEPGTKPVSLKKKRHAGYDVGDYDLDDPFIDDDDPGTRGDVPVSLKNSETLFPKASDYAVVAISLAKKHSKHTDDSIVKAKTSTSSSKKTTMHKIRPHDEPPTGRKKSAKLHEKINLSKKKKLKEISRVDPETTPVKKIKPFKKLMSEAALCPPESPLQTMQPEGGLQTQTLIHSMTMLENAFPSLLKQFEESWEEMRRAGEDAETMVNALMDSLLLIIAPESISLEKRIRQLPPISPLEGKQEERLDAIKLAVLAVDEKRKPITPLQKLIFEFVEVHLILTLYRAVQSPGTDGISAFPESPRLQSETSQPSSIPPAPDGCQEDKTMMPILCLGLSEFTQLHVEELSECRDGEVSAPLTENISNTKLEEPGISGKQQTHSDPAPPETLFTVSGLQKIRRSGQLLLLALIPTLTSIAVSKAYAREKKKRMSVKAFVLLGSSNSPHTPAVSSSISSEEGHILQKRILAKDTGNSIREAIFAHLTALQEKQQQLSSSIDDQLYSDNAQLLDDARGTTGDECINSELNEAVSTMVSSDVVSAIKRNIIQSSEDGSIDAIEKETTQDNNSEADNSMFKDEAD